MDWNIVTQEQKAKCQALGSEFWPIELDQKIGISSNVKDGIVPINGLRHLPEADTTGWYIWAGEEMDTNDDFFLPLHVKHLGNWNSEVLKFLALPPGWRFLKDGDYEDVWFDGSLLT
jgi:hypothetical protein